ncbi:MAG: DNRLRE domain-containing protein, partial [Actinomycetota bacterium]|nr:DNRLRE domain-containing protein [Actinomycetota bacterium]
EALRVAAPWAESQVHWNNRPQAVGIAATANSGLGWREWSVTSQVEAMYTVANHGFLLRDAIEGDDAEQQFHSREKDQNVPQLVLRFAQGEPGIAPALDAGLPGVTTFMSRATRIGRTKLPPSSFVAYRFACTRACTATTSGHITARGSRAPIALKAARFKGGPGRRVHAKVTLPPRAVRLVKQRRRAQLALQTVVMSGRSAARLPARIRIDAKR